MKINKNVKDALKKVLSPEIFSSARNAWHQNIKPFCEPIKTLTLKKLTNHTQITAVHESGIKYEIILNKNNGFVDQIYFLDKIHEQKILSLIKNNLPEGGVYIDIGTNIGGHALFAAKVVGEKGLVYAFEPILHLYNQALESININELKNVKLYNFGLGDKEYTSQIYINSRNEGNSSLVFTTQSDKEETVSVKVSDSILKEIERPIDFVKIDVEGFEYNVLLGMKDTFISNKPKNVLIEFSPFFYNEVDKNISKNILDLMESYGYTIFDVNEGEIYKKINKENFTDFINSFGETKPQTNIICSLI